MFKAFACLLLTCLAAPALAGGELRHWLAGEWRGVGVQTGDLDWAVRLSALPTGATVDYPDVPCGGTWVFGKIAEERIEATEVLSYGRELCIDDSPLVVTRYRGDLLLVRWQTREGEELALAVLYRAGTRPPNYKAEKAESLGAWAKH